MSLDLNQQEMTGFWDGSGPYANNLRLASEKQRHKHLITQIAYKGSKNLVFLNVITFSEEKSSKFTLTSPIFTVSV